MIKALFIRQVKPIDFKDNIILTATVLTALGVIIATAVKIYKFIRKWEKWVEEQSEHNLDNYLSIKRLTIMSHEMPLSERISAGEKYIKYGGNGEVRHKYEELLTFLPSENKME